MTTSRNGEATLALDEPTLQAVRTRRVWKRQEDTAWPSDREFPTGRDSPPVNGIPSWLGGVPRGVVKIEPRPQTTRSKS